MSDIQGPGSEPGVVIETGELIPGYMAPAQLLAHIQKAIATDEAERKVN